ncbi:hypothetical protein D7Z54_01390 [Salibacterium salarium]|uniref:Zinc-ribbon domain-containing protein n=1 Tax=Salibacterium salarium TaxID=284579 RepID=A0A3R9WWT9_9BACI|nr:FxLYD domain-containing protein [Salibacterium salarium]RSL35250.1 hypothetical protein D7Z54_01390 [Salibacterium salarium]
MKCGVCGTKHGEQSKFCQHCGEAVKRNKTRSLDPSVSNTWKAICVFLPVLFAMTGGVFLFFAHEKEKSVNADVLQLQDEMEVAVSNGAIDEAVALSEEALAYRPDEEALRDDQEKLRKVSAWQEDREDVLEQVKASELEEAKAELTTLEEKADTFADPLSGMLSESLKEAETSLFLAEKREEMKGIKSVEELGRILSSLDDYEGEAADTLVEDIQLRMEGMAYDNASEQLTSGNINGAEQALNRGLEFLPESDKLLALEKKIEQKRLAAQKAEKERKEQRLIQEAAEDQKNQTEAADVVKAESFVDDYGDLHIEGEVVNEGTASISGIEVVLAVYEMDNHLGDVVLGVTPYQLAPGESGSFSDYYIGPFERSDVEVKDVSWYVN